MKELKELLREMVFSAVMAAVSAGILLAAIRVWMMLL